MLDSAEMLAKAGNNGSSYNKKREAIKYLKDIGSFAEAAKATISVADFLEKEGQELEAIDQFLLAEELFGLSKFHSTDQNKAKLKAADLYLKNNKIPECIKLYEELAAQHLSSSLLRFHPKALFVKSVMGLLSIAVF